MRIKGRRYIGLLKKYLGNQWIWIGFLGIFMFANIVIQLYTPRIIREVLDGIVEGITKKQIINCLVLFLILILLGEVVKVVVSYVSGHVGWQATNKLRKELLEHCLTQTEASMQIFKPGQILEVIEGDVKVLNSFFSTLLISVIQAIMLVIGTLAIIYTENIWVGVIETVYVVFVFCIFGRIHNIAVPKWRTDREHSAKFYGYLGECLDAREDVKPNGAVPVVMSKLNQLLKSWMPDNIRAGVFGMTSYAVHIFMAAISYAIVFGCGAFLWRRGVITVGTIFLFYQYNQNILMPIEGLRRQMDDLQRVNASIEQIQALLEQPTENEEGTMLESDSGIEISVKHLKFSYLLDIPVLKDVSFQLGKKQILGIVGRTGSGKTTLVKLLTKMYLHSEGEICLNQMPISDISVRSIRSNIAYVSQEVQVFDASLRDNITFFDESIEDEELIYYINELGLKEWLDSLEDGLNTRVQGRTLSSGQAQMIVLIRAFLKDAKLVILDEPYANIDPLTEQYIQQVMDRLFSDRTIIIIAHRLKTLERVDYVMLMEQGRVVEYGDYKELSENLETGIHRLLSKNVSGVLK